MAIRATQVVDCGGRHVDSLQQVACTNLVLDFLFGRVGQLSLIEKSEKLFIANQPEESKRSEAFKNPRTARASKRIFQGAI